MSLKPMDNRGERFSPFHLHLHRFALAQRGEKEKGKQKTSEQKGRERGKEEGKKKISHGLKGLTSMAGK